MTTIEQIRMSHDIHDVLGTNKRIIVCPLPFHFHHKNTPSFSIYWKNGRQWWKCHGSCHKEGDIIDLIGYLRIPGYNPRNPADVHRAAEILDDRYKIVLVKPEKRVELSGDEWNDYLPAGYEVTQYAKKRGLKDITLVRFKVGQYDGSEDIWMTMPCFHEKQLVGIKMRRVLTLNDPRYINRKGSRSGLFNYDDVYLTQQHVFIVKAEIPCMLLHQLGFLACAPTGGEGWLDDRISTVLALAKKTVIGDNDEPGIKLGEKRAKELKANLVFPPNPYKDIDEYYLSKPTECEDWLNDIKKTSSQ